MSQKHILANKCTNFELFSNACFTLVSKVTIHFKIFNANSMLSMLHTGLANFQNCPCGVSLIIFYRMLSILGWDLSYHLQRVDKIQGRKGRIRIFYSPAGSSGSRLQAEDSTQDRVHSFSQFESTQPCKQHFYFFLTLHEIPAKITRMIQGCNYSKILLKLNNF